MSVYESSIDDNDSAVLYGNGWVLVTSDPPWTGTMHSTSDIGSVARVRFTGSAVAVICTIPTGGEGQRSMATFSIDGGPAVLVTHLTTMPVQFQFEFWRADSLTMGSHLLVITNVGNEAYFRLDRIDYDPTDRHSPQQPTTRVDPPPTLPPVTSVVTIGGSPSTVVLTRTSNTGTTIPTSNAGTSSPSDSSLSGGPISSLSTGQTAAANNTSGASSLSGASSTVLPANDTPSAESSSSPIAAIVAGVLGGLLFLVLFGFAIFFLLRRRRRRLERSYPENTSHPREPVHQRNTVPVPFNLGHDTRSLHSSSHLMSPEEKISGWVSPSRCDGPSSLTGISSSRTPTSSEAGSSSSPRSPTPTRTLQTSSSEKGTGNAYRMSELAGFNEAPPPAYPGVNS